MARRFPYPPEPPAVEPVDRLAAPKGVPRSEVLRASTEDYLFVRRLRALRQRMMAAALAKGIHTDEDVFDRVS